MLPVSSIKTTMRHTYLIRNKTFSICCRSISSLGKTHNIVESSLGKTHNIVESSLGKTRKRGTIWNLIEK